MKSVIKMTIKNGTLLTEIFDNLNKGLFLSASDKKRILKFEDLVKDYLMNVNPDFLEQKVEYNISSTGKTIRSTKGTQNIILTDLGENIFLSLSFSTDEKRREDLIFNYPPCELKGEISQEIGESSFLRIKYSGIICDENDIKFKIDKINEIKYDKTDTSLLTKSNEVIYDVKNSEPDIITSYSELTRKINDAIEMGNIKKINRKGGIKNV